MRIDYYEYIDGRVWDHRYQRWAGSRLPKGYILIRWKRKLVGVHRWVWEAFHGPIPEGFWIDHINGVPEDNRIENLRLALPSQNSMNSTRHRDSKSPYKGVCKRKRGRTYEARIYFEGKFLVVGSFKCPVKAAEAYDLKARELFGEFAKTNFPLKLKDQNDDK